MKAETTALWKQRYRTAQGSTLGHTSTTTYEAVRKPLKGGTGRDNHHMNTALTIALIILAIGVGIAVLVDVLKFAWQRRNKRTHITVFLAGGNVIEVHDVALTSNERIELVKEFKRKMNIQYNIVEYYTTDGTGFAARAEDIEAIEVEG